MTAQTYGGVPFIASSKAATMPICRASILSEQEMPSALMSADVTVGANVGMGEGSAVRLGVTVGA